MRPLLRALAVCLLISGASALLCPAAVAQVGCGFPPLWDFPSFASQPLEPMPWDAPDECILVDDFEYWDSLHNHGWRYSSPDYPIHWQGY
ncbi:MAG: hypothetical protein ACMUIL_13840 [bacterium]